MWINCSCSLLKMKSSLLPNPVICLPLAKRQNVWTGEVRQGGICFVHSGTAKNAEPAWAGLHITRSLLSHMASRTTVSWQNSLCVFKIISLEFSDSVAHSWEPWMQQRTVIACLLLALCRSWYPWGATTGPGACLVCYHVKITLSASPGLPLASPESHFCTSPMWQNSSRENLASSRLLRTLLSASYWWWVFCFSEQNR